MIEIARAAAWLSTTPTCTWWRAEREMHVAVPPYGQDPDRWMATYTQMGSGGEGAVRHHTPDLVAELAGTVTAVEVERTQKEGRRLRAIIEGWGRALNKNHVGRVLYVVPDQRMATVISRARDDAASRVAVLGTDAFLIRTIDQLEPLEVPNTHLGNGGHPDAEHPPASIDT